MKKKLCLICNHEVIPEEVRTKDHGICCTILVYKVNCKNCGTSASSYDERILDFYADVPEIEEAKAPEVDYQAIVEDFFKSDAKPFWYDNTQIYYGTLFNDRNSGDNFGNR